MSEEYQKKIIYDIQFPSPRMQSEMSIHSTAACDGVVKELQHKFILEQTSKAERGSRVIAVLFL